MSDHPIIFSAPMIRALLDGRKTMTRRLAWRDCKVPDDWVPECAPTIWQRVKPGDRLWCREAWAPNSPDDPDAAIYRADDVPDEVRAVIEARYVGWRPSIHMPRWASRLTLIVTATKIERLQEISADDAKAEGVEQTVTSGSVFVPQMEFMTLWRALHGPGSWEANPEVVALSFRVHKTNIDQLPKAEAA